MKTQATLQAALNKYKKELATIRERLENVTEWLDATEFMRSPDLFVAQVKERDELRAREKDMDFKVRFTEWILEDDK
jgi:hypothetical protein